MKEKKRLSLGIKTYILIVIIMILLVGISITVSYNVHKKMIDSYYKSLVSQIGKSEAQILDKDTISVFLELLKTDEYQQMLDTAIKNNDEQAVIDYLTDKDLYDDYLQINSQLDCFRENMEIKYLYIESVQGEYSLSLFDPQESILTLGVRLNTNEAFLDYTTNSPIPATVSKSEYGWLCSGYESVIDDSGKSIALVGVDIDMNEVISQRKSFLYSLIFYILLLVFAVAALTVYFTSKTVVKPLNMLSMAVKEFVNSDSYSFNDVMNLPIHTRDEIEELYIAVQKMEVDIIEYIQNIKKVTVEKERISAELNVATQIQADMLPSIFPAFPDRKEFDIYASMTPAKEVGGDFYDFFLIDNDHLAIVMADVSGKGVPAALFMVIAKTLIKNRTQMICGNGENYSPAEILSYVNEQLCEGNEAELFVTVWLGILQISTGQGIAANAGHEYPTIRRAGGNFELVKTKHSPAVAAMEGMKFREHSFELHSGDSLYVYTDGVPEATNVYDELFGTDRMLAALNEKPDSSAKELLNRVKKRIDAFVGNASQFDDITMLCLNYFGEGEMTDAGIERSGKNGKSGASN